MVYSHAVATTLDETLAERDNQAKTCNSENNSVVNPILEQLMDYPTRIEVAVIDWNCTTAREGLQHIQYYLIYFISFYCVYFSLSFFLLQIFILFHLHTRFGDACPATCS